MSRDEFEFLTDIKKSIISAQQQNANNIYYEVPYLIEEKLESALKRCGYDVKIDDSFIRTIKEKVRTIKIPYPNKNGLLGLQISWEDKYKYE